MNRLAFLLLLVVLSCHRSPATTPTPPLETHRVRIANDRLGWYADTIPIVRYDPPYVYGMWRLRMEACSGVTKLGWPKFYMAPISPLNREWAVGIYAPRSESIVIALGAESADWVISHELLHWLLAPRSTKDHPAEYFGPDSPCGRFVNPPPNQG